ncbi:MAG TPA: HD domain-containing phosphohydrolase [Terriglobia bacterium]|nr:HD domain-containing phosphohydrolase [Terriglobia bacterium]
MSVNSDKVRILVVDDEAAVRSLLSARLVIEGYECALAADARQAKAQIAAAEFHLVLCDLRMPGISGLELLKEVRVTHPHLAFVICTGEDDVRTGIESMKLGASDYLVKPLQLDMMVASVARALQKRRLEVELEQHRNHLEEMVQQRTRQLQSAIQRIERTYDETLAALGGALELRDIETQGHSRRVTHYCLEMARALHCSPEELRVIARGSFLHDIGKIGIPDAILLKPYRLTDEEMSVMQSHARIGYELVCRIAFLTPAAQIVLSHQERWDGTGYPQGLRGTEIVLGARIFAVADTLDAMTSDRPYRAALPFAAAHDEIAREAGRQFDPDVVKAFLEIPEEVWHKIRREATERPQFGIAALAGPLSREALAPEPSPPAGSPPKEH